MQAQVGRYMGPANYRNVIGAAPLTLLLCLYRFPVLLVQWGGEERERESGRKSAETTVVTGLRRG